MFAGMYLLNQTKSKASVPRSASRKSQLDILKHAAEDAARETEMLFQLADANADWRLNFEEFRNLVDARLRKPTSDDALRKREAKLTEWYRVLDANADGVIDPCEYFKFALRECLFRLEVEREDVLRGVMTKAGAAKDQSAFNILVFGDLHDKEGKTNVHRMQMAKVATRLGFNEDAGEKLFDQMFILYLKHLGKHDEAACCEDGNDDEIEVVAARRAGIDATFLLKQIHRQTANLRPLIVEFMANRQTAPDNADNDGGEIPIEPFDDAIIASLMAIKGDVHGLLRKLREVLRADMQRGESIFRSFDGNGSFAISAGEFGDGLKQLGFDAPKEVIEAIFDELDDDDSFKIGFQEFKTWLYGSDELFEAQLAD